MLLYHSHKPYHMGQQIPSTLPSKCIWNLTISPPTSSPPTTDSGPRRPLLSSQLFFTVSQLMFLLLLLLFHIAARMILLYLLKSDNGMHPLKTLMIPHFISTERKPQSLQWPPCPDKIWPYHFCPDRLTLSTSLSLLTAALTSVPLPPHARNAPT